MPFTSLAASSDAYRLAKATASSIATSAGTSPRVELVDRDPQGAPLDGAEPVGGPAVRAAVIRASSSCAAPRPLGESRAH